MSVFYTDSASFGDLQISGALTATASWAYNASNSITASYLEYPIYIDNEVTVGLPGSVVNYNSIQAAVNSITDASQYNPYTVIVGPGVYIEDTITVPSWVNIKGDSSISTIVSASNPDNGIFVLSDQSMVIDMQIQGSTLALHQVLQTLHLIKQQIKYR